MTLRFSELEVDPERHEIIASGKAVKLTNTERKLLLLFCNNPGSTFSRRQIINAVLGENSPSSERTVDVHIASLRSKLNQSRVCIETVRGVGFRLKQQSADAGSAHNSNSGARA